MRRTAAPILGLVAGSFLGAVPASAAPGTEVVIGESPAAFTIGAESRTLTAVAATDQGRRCRKVRWALQLRTEGVSLDQVRISRVENGQSFRVRTQLTEEGAQLLDADLDPGELCRGRTVTGRWDIAFTGPDDGTVTFDVSAFDVVGRELGSARVDSRVTSPVAASPAPSRTPSSAPAEPSPEPSEAPPSDAESSSAEVVDPPAAAGSTAAGAIDRTSGTPSVLGPGLVVGALLVFLGVGLLMRLRTRNRHDPAWQTDTQPLPTGFYHLPRKRSS